MKWKHTLKSDTLAVFAIALSIIFALFPQAFSAIGKKVIYIISNFWLQITLAIIVTLLILVFRLLLKNNKAS